MSDFFCFVFTTWFLLGRVCNPAVQRQFFWIEKKTFDDYFIRTPLRIFLIFFSKSHPPLEKISTAWCYFQLESAGGPFNGYVELEVLTHKINRNRMANWWQGGSSHLGPNNWKIFKYQHSKNKGRNPPLSADWTFLVFPFGPWGRRKSSMRWPSKNFKGKAGRCSEWGGK